VIFATGTEPNDTLGKDAALRCAHGIVVDDRMRTSHAKVFAIGECASWRAHHFALVEPVYRQANVLAAVLCGEKAAFEAPAPAARLKVSGTAVFSAGEIGTVSNGDEIVIRDRARGIYRRLQFLGDRLIGAVLLGDITGSLRMQQLIESATPIAAGRDRLAFGLDGIEDPAAAKQAA
jgi:nitrite reductase (NADH) large subunit